MITGQANITRFLPTGIELGDVNSTMLRSSITSEYEKNSIKIVLYIILIVIITLIATITLLATGVIHITIK